MSAAPSKPSPRGKTASALAAFSPLPLPDIGDLDDTATVAPRFLAVAVVVGEGQHDNLWLHRAADVSTVDGLLVYGLQELEEIADTKGGIRRLPDEKWANAYHAQAPHRLFSDALRYAA